MDVDTSPSDLLKRPKLPKEQQYVKKMVDEYLPQNAYITKPTILSGSLFGISSIGFEDLDGDGKDELYTFFVNPDALKVGFMIFKKNQDTWDLYSEIQEVGVNFSYAGFFDFDNDGVLECVFGVLRENAYNSVFFISKDDADGDGYKILHKGQYVELIVDNFDDDDKLEIAVFKLENNRKYSAEILRISDKIEVIDKKNLNLDIKDICQVKYAKLNEKDKAFVIDFSIGSKYMTNLLFFKDNRLDLAFKTLDNRELQKTTKNSVVFSSDINNDGFIDIMGEFVSQADALPFELWQNYSTTNTLEPIILWYKNQAQGLFIEFKDILMKLLVSKELIFSQDIVFSEEDGDYAEFVFSKRDKDGIEKYFSFSFVSREKTQNLFLKKEHMKDMFENTNKNFVNIDKIQDTSSLEESDFTGKKPIYFIDDVAKYLENLGYKIINKEKSKITLINDDKLIDLYIYKQENIIKIYISDLLSSIKHIY